MKKILVTGAAGFIGFHYVGALCRAGYEVLGIDNLNDYYDPALKEARLRELEAFESFEFRKMDLCDRPALEALFAQWQPEIVVNLAAQAGVRYSIENPHAYVDSNLVGFVNILEACRHHATQHLIYASSSSVYGMNKKVPFSTSDNVDHPISLYAATKKSNELMAHTYAHLYSLPVSGLRFFTVYGPWGRPDMAYYKFTKAILEGRPIDVYNNGDMMRDFTYVDDIVEAMVRLVDKVPDKAEDNAPYRLYNIGNHKPEQLLDMIGILEDLIGRKAEKNFLPMQAGDVVSTFADIEDLEAAIGFTPSTPLKTGLEKFVAWYNDYYKISYQDVRHTAT